MKEKNFINKLFARIGGIALAISLALGVGTGVALNRKEAKPVYANEGDVLTTISGSGSGYQRRAVTDTGDGRNVGWIIIGQSGYLGINNANNNTGAKAGVNANDLPVAKAVDANATSSTSTSSNSCTGYYTFYTTSALTNAGSLVFYYSANSGNEDATGYVVYSDTASTNGGAAWEQVPLSDTSASAQGVSLGTSGTFTFTFEETQTSAKYYGFVISTSSYKRMTGGSITIKEGATSGDVEQKYSVTYLNGGATSGTVPTDNNEYDSGDEVTVLGNTGSLAKDGYVFAGWNDGINDFEAGDTFDITADTTLTAVWNAEEGVDVLDRPFTGIADNGGYGEWSEKAGAGSDAIYAGNSAGGKNSIQLRSDNNNSGIVSTTSGGKITRITVAWHGDTSNGRTLNVYGKNTAFSTASDLYSAGTQGTSLGTIVKGTSTSLTISGTYRFIGIRSNSGAMYLTSVKFEWEEIQLVPSVSIEPDELELKTNQNEGATLTATVLDVQNPTYQWTASNDNVTLLNADTATVTIKPNINVDGSSRVTVTVGGVEPNLTAFVDVTIKIPEKGETAETAFTVAEAIDSIDERGAQNNVYVRGIISQVDTYLSSYKSITYWISDDGSTENQFEVYSGKGLNGSDFSSKEDIETGATVIICGDVKKYNTTYEFDHTSQMVSYTAAPRYTVTFESLSTNGVDPIQNVKKGTCVTSLPVATKNNDTVNQKRYEFAGWYTVANPENPVFEEVNRFTSSTPVNGNTTVYAKYNEISYYVVTFNTNGGSSIEDQNVDSGETVVLPSNPTKASDASYTYTFEGWYSNVGLTDPFDDSEPITSNKTIYAKYTAEAISNPGSYLSSATSVATVHGSETSADEGTITKTMSEIAAANDWVTASGNGAQTCYTSFNLNSNIQVSTTGSANCGSFWGTDWRLYQAQNGNVIISAVNGYQLVSVKFIYTVSNSGILKYGDETISSNSDVALTGNSATFTVARTGSGTNGQIRITSISVSYERQLSVSNVALRFGASIAKSEWDAIGEHDGWQITDYGVMLMKATDLEETYSSVEDAYDNNASSSILKILNKRAGGAEYADPYLDGDNYLFTVKVSFPNDRQYYDDVIYAAPFVVVNDQYYFLDEMHTSVEELASDYYETGYSYLSDAALSYLVLGA